MKTTEPDFSTTVAGVRLPFPAMNAAGVVTGAGDLRTLAHSRTGAIVLKSSTVHPFVHPEFRSLHNPGFDKIVPMARELVQLGKAPVIASIAGTNADEYATLGRAFAEAGVALLEANLADPYIGTTVAPFDAPGRIPELLGRLARETLIPVAVKVPDHMVMPLAVLAKELDQIGLRVVVIKNDFIGFEKFQLEAPHFELIAVGGIQSGYDVTRALQKGAKAVQVGSALVTEGTAIFTRFDREMRIACSDRHD
jgi:dihydroorotate dehydrogenase